MKVLYLDQTGQLGGGEIALLPWLCQSDTPKNMVLFEDGPFRARLEACGVHVNVLDLNSLKHVKRESTSLSLLKKIPALLSLRRKLNEFSSSFDVLYANSQKAFLLAALCKKRHQKLVWHLRDILTAEHFSPALRKIAVIVGNYSASIVITNSAATADAFTQAGGRADKIRIIHDGVSPVPFDAVDQESIEALRAELSASAGPLVGIFGRLSPWKGQHILLEAISGMPGVQCVIVGDCLFGEESYAETLKVRAARADLQGRVHFLGFRRDIPALMRSMDIIVHASTSAEPFGLVIVEGLLARRPVIATRAGGAVEIVRSGQDGLLLSPGSVEELRTACTLLLEDSELAQRLVQAGRERAVEQFSVDRLCANISSTLDSLQ